MRLTEEQAIAFLEALIQPVTVGEESVNNPCWDAMQKVNKDTPCDAYDVRSAFLVAGYQHMDGSIYRVNNVADYLEGIAAAIREGVPQRA